VKITHVLCPIDFSDASEHAAEQAVTIARWYDARVTALHVYTPPVEIVPSLPDVSNRVPLSELERARDRALALFRPGGDGPSVDLLIEPGYPPLEILRHAARLGVDLIVMGTHGASGFERVMLGSVTEKVLRKAACAVLTVPPRTHSTSRFPFTEVLCAIDFSAWSSAALAFASSLAFEAGATLTLLHVVEWPWLEPPPPPFEELPREQAVALAEFRRYAETSAIRRLESLVPADASRECAFRCRVAHGKAYVEILRAAAEGKADLIVMGVHGRNPLDLTLFGSTTSHVVRRATCPVLTLRR
jgi:nucleotide-binding universal stress UspA family protein